MKAEKNNKKSNPVGLTNPSIAIGKGKSARRDPALSSQDVFSDSANASGASQKTSLPSDAGRGKEAQLGKTTNPRPGKKQRGGRNKLQPCQRRTIKLQVHVTTPEYEELTNLFQLSGKRYLSDYLRVLVLDRKIARSIVNRKDLIKHLDGIGVEMHRIGNNINQLAKYANIQNKSGKIDQNTMSRFNTRMEKYHKVQQDLVKAYRALVRNEE